MARQISFEMPTDTSFFTPAQLLPKVLCSLAWNAVARWFKAHVVSFPHLVKDYNLGMVILSIDIDYLRPLSFFDAETLEITAGFKVRKGGSRFQLDMEFNAAGRSFAKLGVVFCPVRVEDPVSLAAVPTKIEGALLAKFQADEIDQDSPVRIMPDLEKQIIQSGRLLAEGTKSFFINHHRCEVADQWSWIEIPALIESSREHLALKERERIAELRKSLSQPLVKLDAELRKPYFLFDEGRIQTQAYWCQDRMAFIHRMFGSDPKSDVHAIMVEQF